ncbi:hypothetical protein Mgra_00001656 [Meloidogyne graminicola]|uniref:Uncharacterized protein n=1 Tax=Meloidogyne graminicola TaxID=189291 RepID=A0A8S9ZYY2_9BILA|nr:hypothetical protein Mgra_00001656 [Meloidogyne graminicola]
MSSSPWWKPLPLIFSCFEGNEEEKQLKIFANQPLLHLCSPLKLIEENPSIPSIENGRIHSSKEDLKIISQKELEETKSLDRNLFSIKWNKRLNNSSTKLNCNNKNIRPTLEKRKENINGDYYDSPSIALLDPCTSTSSSPAIQNSNSSHSSVPQRLAIKKTSFVFFSVFCLKDLKELKVFPKIQSALSRDKLSSGVGSEQLLFKCFKNNLHSYLKNIFQ